MIDYNANDYNVDKIERTARLKLKTEYNYRIYGLADKKEHPIILIELNFDLFNGEVGEYQMKELYQFFINNGVSLKFKNNQNEQKRKIWVGIRRDFREDVRLSSSAVQTIVYFLEGKLDLDTKFNIPGIPFRRRLKK